MKGKIYKTMGIIAFIKGEYTPRILMGNDIAMSEFAKKLEEAYKKHSKRTKQGYK